MKFTVLVPLALLAGLIIYNATLDGAGEGVRAYIGEWCAVLTLGCQQVHHFTEYCVMFHANT